MTLQVKLEGRSGCPIKIVEKGGKVYVNKASSSLSYNSRLRRQVSKQNEFKQLFLEDIGFFAPKVYSIGEFLDGIAFFEMEYVQGEKFSDFFQGLSLSQLDSVIEKFINYFFSAIENAKLMEVPDSITKIKSDEVKQKVWPMAHYSEELKNNLFSFLNEKKPMASLPQNFCHGDFTFSNMLFKENGQICVFDFLDSFIESPLIDLVKLRQDTKFLWSVLIDENLENHKVVKVIQILDFMDKKLDLYLRGLSTEIQEWYSYLEIFNLARIMPYAQKQSDIQFLNKNLTQLLNTI
jgi:aminoglycoside phosphotransferase (APT) family kinase protein